MSDYFAAMFTSDVREAKQDEVKMEGVDPEALWVLVQYAYTGAVIRFLFTVSEKLKELNLQFKQVEHF